MTRREMDIVVKEQLAADLGYGPELLDADKNMIVEWRDHPERRRYSDDTPKLEILIWNGHLFAACCAELLPWAREHFPKVLAPWCISMGELRTIDRALSPLGLEVRDAHHFYLPDLNRPEAAPLPNVRWYDAGEIEQFRGDKRWTEALAFLPTAPDILAVTASDENGTPIAMAGASRDSARMWQIGINVEPEQRGRGLGAGLTALLKDEIFRRGAVPFYGTAESHIFSQNVALNAGFRPAFAWLYAEPISKGDHPHG